MKSRFMWEAVAVILLTFIVTFSLNDFYYVDGVKQGLIALTVIAHVFILLLALTLLIKPEWLNEVRASAREFAFTVALVATSGSLFYSELAGYVPCKLCWFQRIFMYPLVLLLGIALYKKEDIKKYVAPMTIIGGLIAIYHYVLQIMEAGSGCAAVGTDCAAKFFFSLGYITIPMMAFTAFLLITVMLFLGDPIEVKEKPRKSRPAKKSKSSK